MKKVIGMSLPVGRDGITVLPADEPRPPIGLTTCENLGPCIEKAPNSTTTPFTEGYLTPGDTVYRGYRKGTIQRYEDTYAVSFENDGPLLGVLVYTDHTSSGKTTKCWCIGAWVSSDPQSHIAPLGGPR